MKQLGTIGEIEAAIGRCRAVCAAADVPFHVDALAAELGISYETLVQYAAERGTAARVLRAAVQECTASVIAAALRADPKTHTLGMYYLRNRAGFADKGDKGESRAETVSVTFVGEERI